MMSSFRYNICVEVCQWLATGLCFSPRTPVSSGRCFSLRTPVSSINKTYLHHITEIELKVALNVFNPNTQFYIKIKQDQSNEGFWLVNRTFFCTVSMMAYADGNRGLCSVILYLSLHFQHSWTNLVSFTIKHWNK